MSFVNYLRLTRILSLCFTIAVVGSVALPASAQGDAESGAAAASENASEATPKKEVDMGKRWIPSIAAQMGVTMQSWDGAYNTALLPGGVGPPEPIRPPDDNNDLDVTPTIGISLELMTPELPIPMMKWKPRVFVGGEIIPLMGFKRALAREGDPGVLASPTPSRPLNPFPEEQFLGLGSETTAEISDVGWGAYAGVSFPFEIYDRVVRFKPNIAWMRYRVNYEGVVVSAQCSFPNDCPNPAGFIRPIVLNASTSESFHGLGPGFDVEVETTLFDGIGSTVFAGFRSYRLLTGQNVEFGTSEVYNDPVGTGDVANARFTAKVDDWMFRFLFGFRLEWQGKWWDR